MSLAGVSTAVASELPFLQTRLRASESMVEQLRRKSAGHHHHHIYTLTLMM